MAHTLALLCYYLEKMNRALARGNSLQGDAMRQSYPASVCTLLSYCARHPSIYQLFVSLPEGCSALPFDMLSVFGGTAR